MPLLVVALLLILLVGVVLVLIFKKKRKMSKSFPPSHNMNKESNGYGPADEKVFMGFPGDTIDDPEELDMQRLSIIETIDLDVPVETTFKNV